MRQLLTEIVDGLNTQTIEGLPAEFEGWQNVQPAKRGYRPVTELYYDLMDKLLVLVLPVFPVVNIRGSDRCHILHTWGVDVVIGRKLFTHDALGHEPARQQEIDTLWDASVMFLNFLEMFETNTGGMPTLPSEGTFVNDNLLDKVFLAQIRLNYDA